VGVIVLFVHFLAVTAAEAACSKAERPQTLLEPDDFQVVDLKALFRENRQKMHEKDEYPEIRDADGLAEQARQYCCSW